jgi:3-hydroxyacyl-CoA dehydrogenase/enoyl-CoA hydratase/3-hydroxybutyryl-CoA epimerase
MNYKHFKLKYSNNIAWVHFDYSYGSMNVLSGEVLTELKDVLLEVKSDNPDGMVICSDKSTGFIAGADVTEFKDFHEYDDAYEAITKGQEVMWLIDDMEFPTLALINGLCLGGGLELALSCDYRIILDSPNIRVGFPEVKLGIHPGFGGSVRSIRVLGVIKAMGMMLSGRTLSVYQAKKMGLVDYAVPERLLVKSAEDVLAKCPPVRRPDKLDSVLNSGIGRKLLSMQIRRNLRKEANKQHYPAPYALVDIWEKYGYDEHHFMNAEAESVSKLAMTDTAKNLLRVFMLQDLLKSSGDKSKLDLKHVHVIGAGVMGGDIAMWAALRGYKVTLQDIDDNTIAAAMKRSYKFYVKRFSGKDYLINDVYDRLIPDKNGYGISSADIVIEAIVENADIKRQLYSELESEMKRTAILGTNTSSIKLEVLSSEMKNPERLVGIHFFNPVAKMPLVEVVYSDITSEDVIEKSMSFCRHIDKLPLKVKSSPGFLVNRVLMPTLIEAINMLDEGYSKEEIDNSFTDFGMPMGPLLLADTVGLDVCYFVTDIISEDLGITVPKRLKKLVDKGKLGIKSGRGFYIYNKGNPVDKVYADSKVEIKSRLIGKIITECKLCLDEGIVESSDLIDSGIIFGTGFAPFRGGPLHYSDEISKEISKQYHSQDAQLVENLDGQIL